MSSSTTVVSPSSVGHPPPATLRAALRAGLFSVLFLLFLWFVLCRHLSAEWSYNEQYNYGWFVPFFALYLFWLRWEDRPLPQAAVEAPSSNLQTPIRNPKSLPAMHGVALQAGAIRNCWIALAIAILTLLLVLPVRLIEVANPDWRLISWIHAIAAVTLTLLVIWWIGGKPWLRHFAFPVLFFLVSVPWISAIEEPIVQGLMPTVASIATGVLSLFGIPAEVQGNLIHISSGTVGVSEACSGVRSLQTAIMVGLLFGELKRLNLFRRIVLVVAAIAIAFLANCARAFFLVWIAASRGVNDLERWHDIAGYAIVGLVFFGCLGLTAWLAGRKVENQKTEDPPSRSYGVANGGQRCRNSITPILHHSITPLTRSVARSARLAVAGRGRRRILVPRPRNKSPA